MHVCSCFKLCIGEQDEDSWGESGSDEEAQRLPDREVLHGNQQRCLKRFILAPLSNLFVFRLY
ncbi:hypothetical protein ABEY65_00530 [Priestia aryabhattai]|uniref:hypothetical protein n=1 Tax=Priestia aryabhattai TaxID=412384 RepID=UPI003D271B8C